MAKDSLIKASRRDDAQVVALIALHGDVPKAARELGCTKAALYQHIAARPALAAHVATVRRHGSRRGATCSIGGCSKPVRSRGWCSTHYSRWKAHGDPNVCLKPRTASVRGTRCDVDGCDQPVRAKSLCREHYQRAFEASRLTCPVAGCETPIRSGGLCPRHYQRARKYGHPLAGPAFRRQRGTGWPRWLYGTKRDADRAQATPELTAYVEILRADPCSYCAVASCEHIDHIDPFVSGGMLTVENVTSACASCNHRKGSTPLLLFLASSATREGVMPPYGEGQSHQGQHA